MTLQQINYALTIAETKSMNKAAERLYVSQPSLTSAIKEIENEIGVNIFLRTARGVTVTVDGEEFLSYARQVYQQYELLIEKYSTGSRKIKFGVSTQHYSFAVKSFINMVKRFDNSKYEFSIREVKTLDVINDVSNFKSEIGLLFISEYNRRILDKLFDEHLLQFTPLIECKPYVYLWKKHPLADKSSITSAELEPYPFLSFEQGDSGSYYFAEEIFSDNEYKRMIKASDRATMLNLMVGLNAYTFSSGIICEKYNGNDYIAIPFELDNKNINYTVNVGYITKKNKILSEMGTIYIHEVKKYLGISE